MEPFNFEKVYEELARPLDNRPVPIKPFGPILLKVILEENEVFVIGSLPPAVILPFFLEDEGTERLTQLIEQMLSRREDNFCIVKTHECHIKTVQDQTEEEMEEMRDKRLTHDPSAQHCIVLVIYHKSGVRIGCLPIDENRVSHYAPLLPESGIINVKVDAKPIH